MSFGFYLAISSGIVFMIRRRGQAKKIEGMLDGAQLVMRTGPTKATTQAVQPYAAWLFLFVWSVLLFIVAVFPGWVAVDS